MSRLSYDVKESDLEREFGRFGPIERVRLVLPDSLISRGTDYPSFQIRIVADTHNEKKKKPHRGYAFIVYEREKDMKGTESSITTSSIPPSSPPYTVKQVKMKR